MRRTIIIAAAVLLLLAIGVGVYFLFFHHTATITGGAPGTFPSSSGAGGSGADVAASTQPLGLPLPGAGTDIAPRLVRITDRPVALGSIAIYVPPVRPVKVGTTTPIAATEPDVRVQYVERESGNIYAYQAHARTLTRLTNKTLPGIQETSWLGDGSVAYVRFLEKNAGEEHIDTYALPSNGTNGYFLQQDLAQVLARGSSTLVTLLSTTDGSSASVSTPSGGGLHTLFTTPLSAIRLAFFNLNYSVTTKGSATTDGYAFVVDPKTGAFTRILGPLQGFSSLPSPGGRYFLYSYLDNNKLALGVVDLLQHTATRLPLATLPEKCAWASDDTSLYCGIPSSIGTATLPDDWYQGAVSFSDRLWKINMADRVATLLIDPKQAGKIDIDAMSLSVDLTSDVLIFTNKRDGLLYAYDL